MEELIQGGYLPIITGAITFIASYAVTQLKVTHLTTEVDSLKQQQADQSTKLTKLDLLEYQMGEVLKKVSKLDNIATDVAILRGKDES